VKRIRTVLSVALLGLAIAAAIGVAPASAKIKLKDGIYLQTAGKQNGYVVVDRGKVTGAGATMRFSNRAGKPCSPKGLFTEAGIGSFSFQARRPVSTDRRNRFSFKGVKVDYLPALTGSASGRFLTARTASLSIRISDDAACKGSLVLKKAKYSPGG
jgi:hypothetical protein